MKILSVSDLQRTTDGVKEQQLNQTCFGNFLAPKCSRRPRVGADHELPTTLLHPGEGAPGGLGLRSRRRTELGGSQKERTRVPEP